MACEGGIECLSVMGRHGLRSKGVGELHEVSL